MCPKSTSESLNHKSTEEEFCKSDSKVSPLNEILNRSKGGQTAYAFILAYLIALFIIKLILFFISEDEYTSCVNFFGGQLAPIGYFVRLFIVHHLILYSLVYPAGKYFKHNSFILKCTAFVSIILCKIMLYQVVFIQEDSSATVRVASAMENVRIMMLVISFLYEAHLLHKRKADPGDISIPKFTYFLFAPTLVYRSSYERTNRPINWKAFFRYSAEFAAVLFFWAQYMKDILLPQMARQQALVQGKAHETLESYFAIFIYHLGFALLMFFTVAFGLLHSYHNATAELLCFADRVFYNDWWVTMSVTQFLRKWNRIVGSWIHVYPYKFLLSRGYSQFTSLVIIFAMSGFYHDYVMWIATRKFYPFFVFIMLASALLAACPTEKLSRFSYICSTSVIAMYAWAGVSISFFELK